jgi:hypothetical protein
VNIQGTLNPKTLNPKCRQVVLCVNLGTSVQCFLQSGWEGHYIDN